MRILRVVKPWTTGELRQLKWDFGMMPISKIAEKMGRSADAVRRQARHQGLDNHYGRGYRKRICRTTLRTLLEQRVTPIEIAKRLQCSRRYLADIVRRDMEQTYKTIYITLVREDRERYYATLRKPTVGDGQ